LNDCHFDYFYPHYKDLSKKEAINSYFFASWWLLEVEQPASNFSIVAGKCWR